MRLEDVLSIKAEADRGRWFTLLHPVTGEDTGLALQIAGPDSDRQARAQAQMVDDLAEVADPQTGRVSGADRLFPAGSRRRRFGKTAGSHR